MNLVWHDLSTAFETGLKHFVEVTFRHHPQPIDTWNFLPKMRFLDNLVVLRLDLSQISFNLVEDAFATQQLALLATKIMF